ncbi:MAG: chromate transporter [Solobacterium sp.]|jgi:chromate transporter|nr:chromate transporter [Solobacterium sp.]HAE16230.1 chromate transporter [Erysipelotrichaceae bacterium]
MSIATLHIDRVKNNRYLTLFTSTFRLSACTFGGGFVIVPLLKKKFADELGWVDENEIMDLTAIAQSSPGAIAVNASILIGYHVGGVAGALISVIGTVLPPMIIISVISLFYQAFRDSLIVSRVMTGMLAGVAAVITDVVLRMAGNILKEKKPLPVIMLIASFIAVRFFSINVITLILICGSIGAADTYFTMKAARERGF